jgi:hypothetical protein
VPSHDPVVVAKPAEHPPPHDVPVGSEHAVRSEPLHVAVTHAGSPEVAFVHIGREPCGAPITAVHTPPVPLHDSHWPVHALLQQTPSAQKPLVHCEDVVHAPPCGIAHVPAKPGRLQDAPDAQLADPQQTLFTQLPL